MIRMNILTMFQCTLLSLLFVIRWKSIVVEFSVCKLPHSCGRDFPLKFFIDFIRIGVLRCNTNIQRYFSNEIFKMKRFFHLEK